MKKRRNHPKYNPKTIFLPLTYLFVIAGLFFIFTSYDEAWAFDWTGIRQETRDVVKSIRQKVNIKQSSIDLLGIPCKTRSNRLLDNVTVAELYKLTKHPDDVIKFLAYKTLFNSPCRFKGHFPLNLP